MRLFLVVAFLLFASPLRSSWAEDVRQLYREGVEALQAGEPLRAIRSLEGALALDPGQVGTRFVLAQAYHQIYERTGLFYPEAAEQYGRVVETLQELPPGSPRQMALLFLGELLVKGGDYRKALGHLRGFLQVRPDHYAREEVWNSVGVAHYYLNEYEASVEAFEAALDVAPSYSPARFNLRSVFTRLSLFDIAMANRRAGRVDLALQDLERLLALSPRYLPARLQRALLLRESARGEEAEAEARQALGEARDPKVKFQLLELLGDLTAERGDLRAALGQYRKCLQLFPGYIQVVEKMDALEGRLTPVREDAEASGSLPSFDRDSATPVGAFPM